MLRRRSDRTGLCRRCFRPLASLVAGYRRKGSPFTFASDARQSPGNIHANVAQMVRERAVALTRRFESCRLHHRESGTPEDAPSVKAGRRQNAIDQPERCKQSGKPIWSAARRHTAMGLREPKKVCQSGRRSASGRGKAPKRRQWRKKRGAFEDAAGVLPAKAGKTTFAATVKREAGQRISKS